MIDVRFKRLHCDARVPVYSTPGSAGCDIYALEGAIVQARSRAMVRTGLAIEVPVGYECQVRPRSGLASKHGVTVLNSPGTVDSDFRGEMMILLSNTTDEDYYVSTGDRVAQLVFAPVIQASFVEADELSETTRGTGGWGSTGVNDGRKA